jgi:large subunit ribosomal protein L31
MQKTIHPKFYTDCLVTCTCGNSFTTSSTVDHIDVEICSKCHPFFTGQQKFVDAKGRIDKFKEKVAKSTDYRSKKAAKVNKTKKLKKAKQSI